MRPKRLLLVLLLLALLALPAVPGARAQRVLSVFMTLNAEEVWGSAVSTAPGGLFAVAIRQLGDSPGNGIALFGGEGLILKFKALYWDGSQWVPASIYNLALTEEVLYATTKFGNDAGILLFNGVEEAEWIRIGCEEYESEVFHVVPHPSGGFYFVVLLRNELGYKGIDIGFFSNGGIQWVKEFWNAKYQEPNFAELSPDGDLVLLYVSYDQGGERDVHLMKMDVEGNLLWFKTLTPLEGNQVPGGLAIDDEGNIYVAVNWRTGDMDSTLYKLDGDGNVLWSTWIGLPILTGAGQPYETPPRESYVYPGDDYVYTISVTPSGLYVWMVSHGYDLYDHTYLLKFDRGGQLLWIKEFYYEGGLILWPYDSAPILATEGGGIFPNGIVVTGETNLGDAFILWVGDELGAGQTGEYNWVVEPPEGWPALVIEEPALGDFVHGGMGTGWAAGNPAFWGRELSAIEEPAMLDEFDGEFFEAVFEEWVPNFWMLTAGTRRYESASGISPDGWVAGLYNRRTPLLAKFDMETGDMLLNESFSVGRRALVTGLEATGDGVYVTGHGNRRAFVARFSHDGGFEWMLELGGRRISRVNDVVEKIGGGALYAVGQWDGTRSERRGMAFLASIDEATGHVNWIKGIYTRRGDTAKAVLFGEDGLIYVAGTTYSRGRGDAFVAKFTQDGALVDYATFGGSRPERVKGAFWHGDFIYVFGETRSFRSEGVFVAKLDPATLDVSAFTTIDLGRREAVFGGEGLALAGSIGRDRQGFIIELDEDLNVVNARLFYGPRKLAIRDVVKQEGGYRFVGESSMGEGRTDLLVGVLDPVYTGRIFWAEGWSVYVDDLAFSQSFRTLASQHWTPAVIGLTGYAMNWPAMGEWPAVVHINEGAE